MIRLALIGCGEHAEIGHAIPLARYKTAHPAQIELAAVCDLKLDRAEIFSRKYGWARAYQSAEEMLSQEKIDGCIAVVPVNNISQVALSLLRLGIPCVVEKPLGASISEVQVLLDTARATRTPNMVSVNRRFMPFLNRAIQWTRTAGLLRYMRCTFTRHARTEPEFLWGTAVHAVDALRHIAGEIAHAEVRTLHGDGTSAEWYAVDLRFANEVSGRIDILPTAGVAEETYELIGEGFRVIVTCPFGPRRGWRAFRENRVLQEEMESDSTPEDVLFGFYDEAAHFIHALTQQQTLRPSIDDVAPSVELCFQMAKNVERNQKKLSPAKS